MVDSAASGSRSGDLARLLEGLIEAAWLGVLVVAALHFSPYSRTGYEPDKAAMVRGLVLVVVAAWVARRVLGYDGVGRARTRAVLVAGAVLFAWSGSEAVSAALSVAPDMSWMGSYARGQGAWLEIGYLTLFAAAASGIRSWQQWRRIRFAVAATSVPICLLAVLQRIGLGLPQGSIATPVSSTLGNSTFLAGYLVLALFVTADFVAERIADAHAVDKSARQSPARRVRSALAPLSVLALQLAVLVMTRGRAAMVGLGAALALLAVTALARRRDTAAASHPGRSRLRRRTAVVAVVSILLLGSLAAVILTDPSPDEQLVRVATLINPERDTNRVRLLIWNAVSEALTASMRGTELSTGAVRALFGHGQESTWLVLEPFHPPELARYATWQAVPDRAHAQTLEILLGRGLVGLAFYMLTAGGLLGIGLRCAGLLRDKGEMIRCGAAMLMGSLVGATMGLLVAGSLALLGLGLVPGMIVGAAVYLLAREPRREGPPPQPPLRTRLLALLLTGAVVAHLVETQLGIAVTATETHFWVLAGALVALGCGGLSQRGRGATEEDASIADGAAQGLLVGTMLVTLAFGFMMPANPVLGVGSGLATACILVSLALWLGALPARVGRRQVARFASGCALIPIAYVAFHWLQMRSAATLMTGDEILAAAAVYATFFDGYHAGVLFIIVALAVALAGQRPAVTTAPDHPSLRIAAAVVIILALGILLPRSSYLQRGRADIMAAQAEAARWRGQYANAANIYRRVFAARPDEVPYRVALATVYAEWAARAHREDVRDRRFRVGVRHLRRGIRVYPADSTTHANLARLYTLWGELVLAPEARSAHWELADRQYRAALDLRPRSARYLAEWGRLASLEGDQERARDRFRRSLLLDPTDGQTYLWTQAVLHADLAEGAAALAELGIDERAIAPAQVYGALIGHYAETGRLAEAIHAAQQLSQVAPDDPTGHRALAVLHLRAGNRADALTHGRRAYALSSGRERREVGRLLDDIGRSREPIP